MNEENLRIFAEQTDLRTVWDAGTLVGPLGDAPLRTSYSGLSDFRTFSVNLWDGLRDALWDAFWDG